MQADNFMRSAVTPYLMPPSLAKTVNIGDGFILRAIERLIGRFPADLTFSSRELPTPGQFGAMEKCSQVILAGANQLTDDFSVWPGFDGAALARANLRLVPFGIGIHGEARRNAGMTKTTAEIIALIHARLSFSSWRCPKTVDYLNRSLPRLKGHFLMTGCPVLYHAPLLKESRFRQGRGIVAVTPTERGSFWPREAATVAFVARRFPAARRLLIIHQDYKVRPGKKRASLLASFLARDKVAALRRFARARGFEIVVPTTADEALTHYESVDLHIGSRLHAHLHMLSQNRPSFLIKVDERATGFAEHFAFPLCDPSRLDDYMDFDFEPVREKAKRTFEVMQQFIASLGEAA
jgi:hypothetical protein